MFKVSKRLGQGSFGEVFKVFPKHQANSSRELSCAEYAVKKSLQPFISSMDRERKFKEVQRHQALPPHPNCVMFIQAWEEDGYLDLKPSVLEKWGFELDIDESGETGTIVATSTDKMGGGADNVITYDVATGTFTGYGQENEGDAGQ